MITREFQLHIDPSLYGFKFTGANYARVSYGTMRIGDNILIEISGIQLGPTLLIAITDRERLVRDAEAAARNNSQEYWAGQPADVLTGIIKGFAPYI
jgi:hypothetical protein